MTTWDQWSGWVGHVSGWSFRQGSGRAPEKGALLNGKAARPAGQDHLSCQERRGQRQPSSPRAHLPGDPSTRSKQARMDRPPHLRSSARRTCLSPHSQSLSTTEAAFSPTKSTSDPKIIPHTASWKALCPLDVTLWNQPQSQTLELKVHVETHEHTF